VTLEEMGGARMHATISGCGDQLAADDTEAIEQAKQYFSYLPLNWRSPLPAYDSVEPARRFADDLVPVQDSAGYDIRTVVEAIVDDGSLFEVKPLFAPELVTGLALLDGEVIGIVANQPAVKGGVLFVDSADKGARFIWQCDAFSIPLLYLADVPGFMIGSAVERQGIIRHGAKMITAVAEATVPTISLIIRKAYGAGLYAMAGPGFGPDACLALPTAKIAVINDEAERAVYVERLRKEYEVDIDILRLASELVVDAIVEPRDVRRELIARFAAAATKDRHFSSRRHGVPPV
jgi:acetyl-CoA carboxylase carboxyltransferase component